ncbi:NAD(P)-binding protein [Cytidiella melzeri]|nr:NAD(P)-binding protein [Cytidiella melzeri]
MPTNLVLLTGISGFIGSHIAHALLKSGYRVRGTARSIKVSVVQHRYKSYGDKVEIVGVDDIIAGSFEEALKGVDAVIHGASPLAGKTSAEETVKAAEEGAINILRQAEAAGIKNFVQISSITAAKYPDYTYLTEKDWNLTTREEATAEGVLPFVAYSASKALAERAVWDFADKHPHMEISAINPVFNYGPFAPEYDIPDASLSAFSSNIVLYQLFIPQLPIPYSFELVDVRDVAAASVAALHAPPTSEVGRKRFLIAAEPWASGKEVYEYISKIRPELEGRFTEEAKNAKPAPKHYVDNSRLKDVLHIELTPWQTTILDAFDSIVAYEKEWNSKGLVPH